MAKKKGLGRGLQALIPTVFAEGEENKSQTTVGQLREISIDEIRTSPSQPRVVFDEARLNELVESIREHGVIQPVVVRLVASNEYQLIAGERRVRACIQLGRQKIPALVREASDLEASAVALIENIQRENLNPVDEARAYQQLMDNYGLTQEEVSQRVGKSRPFIANMVRLLNLPEKTREMVADGMLTTGHARALLGLGDEKEQHKTAIRVIKKNMSVRQTEEYVRKIVEGGINKTKADRRQDWCLDIGQRLQNALGVKVRVSSSGAGGKIIIEYKTQDELQKIMSLIKR